MNRKSLTDIVHQGERENLSQAWERAEAAADFEPLPAGTYVARIVAGELTNARTTGTPGYKLKFRVLEGEYLGRCIWHDVWLTPAAMPMAKRDLGKLGITALQQLDEPLPPGIRSKVKLALRRDDDGVEFNRVRSFEVIGSDPVEDEAFGPGKDATTKSVEAESTSLDADGEAKPE